jgi:hypothetical protein
MTWMTFSDGDENQEEDNVEESATFETDQDAIIQLFICTLKPVTVPISS